MFYGDIETMFHNNITVGCGEFQFCPKGIVSRAQIAAFLARGFAGTDGLVPATGTVNAASYNCAPGGNSLFSDVSATDPFCRHIHYIASMALTVGCGGGAFCPSNPVKREEAAVFIARAVPPNNPGGNGDIPTAYTDPTTNRSYDCNVATANVPFTDVQATSPFCKYVSYVWSRGIVEGFGNQTFGIGLTVNREQASTFLNHGLQLTAYHP
jgi:hypothetical protein